MNGVISEIYTQRFCDLSLPSRDFLFFFPSLLCSAHPHAPTPLYSSCNATAETVHTSRLAVLAEQTALSRSVYFLFFTTSIGAEAKDIKIGNDKQEETKGGIEAQLCACFS